MPETLDPVVTELEEDQRQLAEQLLTKAQDFSRRCSGCFLVDGCCREGLDDLAATLR
jgi:hypothetical protein